MNLKNNKNTIFSENYIRKCSYCKKIYINDNWQKCNLAIDEKKVLKFTHGICPNCEIKVLASLEAQ
jgi:hypothetical protein